MAEDELARKCEERDAIIAEIEKMEDAGGDPQAIQAARERFRQIIHEIGHLRPRDA